MASQAPTIGVPQIESTAGSGTTIVAAMTALIIYEYVLTVGQAATVTWYRKWTLATWIFTANRTLMFGVMVLQIIPLVRTSRACQSGNVASFVLSTAQYVVFAVFSALRVFALWDNNIPVSLLILVLNLCPMVTNIYLYIQEPGVFIANSLVVVCRSNEQLSTSIAFHWILGARLAVIVADILVWITWQKTYRVWRTSAGLGMRAPISNMLFRNGTFFFIILLMTTIAQLLQDLSSSFIHMFPISVLIPTMTAILVARFILNLRQVAEHRNNSSNDMDINSRFSVAVPVFASIVGNMGEDLHNVFSEEVEDETEMHGL